MKIGIFGGSFNPPHKMHLKLGKELLDRGYIDRLIYVPVGSKYHYEKKELAADQDRYQMLVCAVAGDSRMCVSSYELRDHCVYTYETLAHFQRRYPQDEIYFILGSDWICDLPNWRNGEELIQKYRFLVNLRNQDTIAEISSQLPYLDRVVFTDFVPQKLSSTMIRTAIREQQRVDDYLEPSVLNYIEEHHLYSPDFEK